MKLSSFTKRPIWSFLFDFIGDYMNTKVNNYILTYNKINFNKKILVISDVHSNVSALKSIMSLTNTLKPDYIFMPGDKVDMTDDSDNKEIQNILKDVSKKFPIYLS